MPISTSSGISMALEYVAHGIVDLIGCRQVSAAAFIRLLCSPNYCGYGPRILKITLGTPERPTTVLQSWYDSKIKGPLKLSLTPMHNPGLKNHQGTFSGQIILECEILDKKRTFCIDVSNVIAERLLRANVDLPLHRLGGKLQMDEMSDRHKATQIGEKNESEQAELRKKIEQLSCALNIISPYTAFIGVDPVKGVFKPVVLIIILSLHIHLLSFIAQSLAYAAFGMSCDVVGTLIICVFDLSFIPSAK
ncbi:unnamed protein product [Echinostoma caproni]|uniref:Transmembrane protein n=1 Tax=Echinostoma caproni TaxID=27848 RepID=A0A183AHK3_9TREM|nr:unnamed protein product [Echinostoma caproni]